MKKLFLLMTLPLLALSLQAKEEAKSDESKRVRPNYALAERFSPNKIGRMVKSTSVTPHWFSDGKRFWYSWTYADGTRYYIVDAKGNKKEMWDMEKLAAEISQRTGDPYDAQHLPIYNVQLREDRYVRMGIQSKLEIPKQLKRWERNDSTKILRKRIRKRINTSISSTTWRQASSSNVPMTRLKTCTPAIPDGQTYRPTANTPFTRKTGTCGTCRWKMLRNFASGTKTLQLSSISSQPTESPANATHGTPLAPKR